MPLELLGFENEYVGLREGLAEGERKAFDRGVRLLSGVVHGLEVLIVLKIHLV